MVSTFDTLIRFFIKARTTTIFVIMKRNIISCETLIDSEFKDLVITHHVLEMLFLKRPK